MKQYTERYVIMLTKTQANSLSILKSKGVNPAQFIRQATKEKLQRDWPSIKAKHRREVKNAPDWLYN